MTQLDFRSELDMWTDMWAQAEEAGIHPSPERPRPIKQPIASSKAQDYYYDVLDAEAEEMVLQEQKTMNPIYPDSVGSDHENTPPVWADEKLVKEVESLKKKLFDVENRMAQMGGGKKWVEKAQSIDDGKKMMSEIESLRRRIDQVSSVLGTKHEPSPWETSKVKG